MLWNQRLTFGLGLVALAGGAVGGCADSGMDAIEEPPVEPTNQDVVRSDVAPPPISGGTLLATHDGTRLVAADPDRDRIVVVSVPSPGQLEGWDVVQTIPLEPGDEPGRVTEDAAGRVHVALRRGGAVVTIEPRSGRLLGRRDVCGAPRGVSTDGEDGILVACATGELVSLPGDPRLPATRSVFIERDLRDVVVNDGNVFVSTFRSAQVLRVDADGNVVRATSPRGYTNSFSSRSYTPSVAWRMVPSADGVSVVHQRSAVGIIQPPPASSGAAYYGGEDCSTSIVHSAVTEFGPDGAVEQQPTTGGLGVVVLPVDMAISPSGTQVAVASASNDSIVLTSPTELGSSDGCESGFGLVSAPLGNEPIAVAYVDDATLVVQQRQPSALVIMDSYGTVTASVLLGGERRADTGHELFHRNPDGLTAISCASCHPEGRDDAHTWEFVNVDGVRRTQSLSGGIMDTAPFHWDGDLDGLGDLMTLVFEQRMGGVHQSDERVEVLADWLDTVPRVAAATANDPEAVARGEALYFDATVGCSSCHGGAKLTNDQTVDVGTGKAFQVPGLIGIADRAPFMHDGCAKTLADRFTPECGGGDAHGKTSHLAPSDIADLVAYLEAL